MYKRSDELYLDDIIDSINAIEEFIEGIDFEEFISDRKAFSATIREFEIIGEAAGKISDSPQMRMKIV